MVSKAFYLLLSDINEILQPWNHKKQTCMWCRSSPVYSYMWSKHILLLNSHNLHSLQRRNISHIPKIVKMLFIFPDRTPYFYNSRLHLQLQAAAVTKIPVRLKKLLLIYVLHHAVSYCLPASHLWHTHLPNSTEELQFLDEGKNPSCILEAFCNRKSSLTLPNGNIPGTKKAKHADVWNTAYLNSSNAYMA